MIEPTDRKVRDAAERVAARLLADGHTFVTAESCTGGWIAKACTDLPGSSRWFLGGVVTYSNEAKVRQLGVDAAALRAEGAVSETVVRQMALGVLEAFGADVSVAVSGVAGPDGGTADKPVGTVWLAWARRGAGAADVRTMLEQFPGDREAVRRRTVLRALEGVLQR